jgi:hypothetical protein
MNSIFDGLLEFPSQNDFDSFVESMDKNSAIKMIELSIITNQQKGAYSLEESHILYKCLIKLKENENKNQGNHLHNDDTDWNISSEVRS